MFLTFVTVSARPDNLPYVAEEIERQKADWNGVCKWRIIFDFNQEDGLLKQEVAEFLASRSDWVDFSFLPHPANKISGGNHGKDTIIKEIADGWVYQLDDDNALFPDFVLNLNRMLAEHPEANLFCFWQAARYAPRTLVDIRVGHVDTAMYVFNKTACDGIDYPLHYGGDGEFLLRMINNPYTTAWLEQKNLCFYNRIRGGIKMRPSCELSVLAESFGTDKHARHNYCEAYDKLFAPYRHKEIAFLELGVFQGGSIKMWREWFTQAEIYGVDNGTDLHFVPKIDLPRTQIIKANTQDISVIDALGRKAFDIIIDDAEHHPYAQLKTLWNLWPLLKSGGLYVIEDIQQFDAYAAHWKIFHAEVIDQRQNNGTYDSVMLVIRKGQE